MNTAGYMRKPKRAISELLISSVPVGSRVTCNPPVMNTDADFLILCTRPEFEALSEFADGHDWDSLGSNIPDEANNTRPDDRFHSWRIGEKNYIVTTSESFYKKFLLATQVCKTLNLLEKPKRVVLFQAILYGNPPPEDSEPWLPNESCPSAEW